MHEQNPRAEAAEACLSASNHLEDVLFAAGAVAKNSYNHGVENVVKDIDAFIGALPTYPSLLNDAQKGRFLNNLNTLKETLRKAEFDQAQAIIQSIKNDMKNWV